MTELVKLGTANPATVPVTRFLLQESLAAGKKLSFESKYEQIAMLEGLRNEYIPVGGAIAGPVHRSNLKNPGVVGNKDDLNAAVTFAYAAMSSGQLHPRAKLLYNQLGDSLNPTDRVACDMILLGAAETRDDRGWAVESSLRMLRTCPVELKLSAATVYEVVSGKVINSLR